jgi:hypothetical protein
MRPIYPHELPVVDFLFKASGRAENPAELLVCQMDDGGMGSLKFESEAVNRRYGATVAACEFEDTHGILVSAVLNNDENGLPFEIDVWKVDFTPLLSWPRPEAIRVVES